VLDLTPAGFRSRGIDPSIAVPHLAEDRGAYAIGPQITAQDQQVDLEALVGRFRGGVPIRDDHAAEGIGRSERQEVQSIERRSPEIGIDPYSGARTRLRRFRTA